MDVIETIMFVAIGFGGAFISGLLGFGGAIFMIPVLLYLPELIIPGTSYGMKAVAGMTIVQVFVASLSGFLRHRKNNYFDKNVVISIGSAVLIGTLAGGAVSKYLSNELLQIVFAFVAVFSAALMFIPLKEPEQPQATVLNFNKLLAAGIGCVVGLLAGMIGAGGSFMLMPFMLYVLKIPIKIAVGSSLAISFFAASGGALGKILTSQVIWPPAIALVVGALPGAQLGGIACKSISPKVLKIVMAILMTISAIKVSMDVMVNTI